MSEEKQELMPPVASRVTGTELESWGEREIISEMVERVMWLHPSAKEVGRAGIFAACQLAMLTGASPVPGHNEIHIWWDKKKEITVVMLGINFDRRRAVEVAGGVMYIPGESPRPMTNAERDLYGIGDKSVVAAAICKGYRVDQFDKYLPHVSAAFNIETIWKMISVTGHALCAKSETLKKGRSHQWTAEKRAEADLLRKLVPNLENPERSYRNQQARVHLEQLDTLIPNGQLTAQEADDYRQALLGDVVVVNGESEPVERKIVHWDEIRNSGDAAELALAKGVFETIDQAENAWLGLIKETGPMDIKNMIGIWQSHCEQVLWQRDNPPTDAEWLATIPSVEQVAERAVDQKLRKNLGDAYNDLMQAFPDVKGGWRNVPAIDAWNLFKEPKAGELPHPWLAQMWQGILQQRANEKTLAGLMTKGQMGKLFVLFGEKYANITTDERHEILDFLFDKRSFNDVTKAEASVLIDAMEGAGETLADEMQAILDLPGSAR